MEVLGNLYCAIHRHARRSNCTAGPIVGRGRNGVSALIAGSGLTLMATLVAAHAEGTADMSASATTQAGVGSDVALEEIVITARRKDELLEDVPQTVSAVTPTELQKLNLQNLQDLSGVVPGLQIINSPGGFNDQDTLRGVSFNPNTGTQNTVAFYLNDTFVTNNFITNSNFDVGQIEVLSGPQGTLRGEPAPSGSLTLSTRRPDMERFGGYATVTGTAYDNTNENGAVNLPLIQDKLAVRLAGVADDNDFNGVKSINSPLDPYSHTYAGRASVRFEPIDAIEANVMYQHLYSHLQSFTQVEGMGAAGGVNPNAPANYNGPAITPFQLLGVQTYPNELWVHDDIVTGQIEGHFLGQIVSYDGSYWKYDYNTGDTPLTANQVPAVTAANPIPRKATQFDVPATTERTQTDELRLSSETPILGFLDYTAGFFYRETTNEVNVVQVASFLPGSFGSPLSASDPFIYNSNYTLQLAIQSPKQEKEYSEFVHLMFHLPHDTELTAGGRYISYKDGGFTQGTLLPSGIFVGVSDAVLPVSCGTLGFTSTYPGTCNIPGNLAIKNTTALPLTPQNLSDHPVIYNVSLSHKLEQDLLVYVSSGSSWRPPAVSVGIFNAANDPTLNSLLHLQTEKSYSYEGGFKWTFLENRARLNVAYYHQKFDGFIYNGLPALYLQDNGSGTNTAQPFAFNSNPDAVVNGVDLDTGFRFTRQWNFDLSASFANGHLTGSNVPCSPPSGGTTAAAFPAGTYVFLCPSHASTSVAPNFNFSAQSEYDTPVAGVSGIDGFVRGLYTFYGRNPHASEFYVAPSYGILNLYAGLRSPGGAWEGALFVKNALDAKKLLSVGYPSLNASTLNTVFGDSGYFGAGQTQALPLVTPRQEAGITFTYAFGSR